MKRSTNFMLLTLYLISLFSGITSYCYDHATGEMYTTPIMTIYSALVGIGLMAYVTFFYRIDYNTTSLPLQINYVLFAIRILSLVFTIGYNWCQREEFVCNLNDLQRTHNNFFSRWPMSEKLQQKFEKTLRLKLHMGYVILVGTLLTSYESVKYHFKIDGVLLVIPGMVMCYAINIVMMNYYICIASMNVMLLAINEEMEKILKVCSSLKPWQHSQQIGPGALITQCCKLSDDVDDLAMSQHQVYLLGNRINRMFDIQTACVMLMVYLTNVAAFYMSIPTAQKNQLIIAHYSGWIMTIAPIFMAIYYVDLAIFMRGMFAFRDLCHQAGEMLRESAAYWPAMDIRLEES
uniref:Gustatory receptor n=1 Tax=Stomoxys calcitrans TaxID=35570 RepID=A0A454A0N0_STOCA